MAGRYVAIWRSLASKVDLLNFLCEWDSREINIGYEETSLQDKF